MAQRTQSGAMRERVMGFLMLACAFSSVSLAQTQVQKNAVPATAPAAAPSTPKMPDVPGTELDGVVAIVNGDLVLDSDVDEERRFEALQPYRDSSDVFSRDRAIERLINRDLILQQAKLQPEADITDAEVKTELDALRKAIPDCKKYQCETADGWDRFLDDHGFTEAALSERWRERMEVLRFIEQRFRMGIKITPEEIKDYYQKTMLPEYAKKNVTPPKLETLTDRIQEVLLQQKVSNLLNDWLKSLRAQGSVTVLHPGETAP